MSNDIDEGTSVGELSQDELEILNGLRELVSEESKKDEPKKEGDKKPEFDENELMAIFDAMLTQSEYTEVVNIGKRLRVVWRTRTTGEANAITKIIDSAGFATFVAAQNHSNVLNMSYSIVGFNGKDLRSSKVSDRKAFLESLPEPIIVMLANSLAKFDFKVAKATEVGQENF